MKLFELEEDAIMWVRRNIPLCVKPIKKAKTKFVYPFSSGNSQEQVVVVLGKELYKLQNQEKL